MKTPHIFFPLSLIALAACSSVPKADYPDAETVEVTYHVQPGREMELEALMNRAWTIYNEKHLVIPQSHAMVVEREYGNRPRIVETFTWVSHAAPDHAPQSVREIWNQMQDLCEARGGHEGLEINELKAAATKK